MPHYGVYTAQVRGLADDPAGEGRIQIALPPALAGGEVLAWARLAVPYAGKDRGLFLLPEPGDAVLVAFEGGDLAYPFVLGALWSSYAVPPLAARPENGEKALVLKSGMRLVFDERPGRSRILLETKGGQALTLSDDPAGLRLETRQGASLRIEGDEILLEGGSLRVRSGGEVVVEGQSLRLRAGGELNLEAPRVRIESQSTLHLKGAVVILDGQVETPPPAPPPPPRRSEKRARVKGVVPIPRMALGKPKKIR